jgi:hypothetical protein
MRDIVTAVVLAARLGISRSEVFRLAAMGVLVRKGRGRYPTARNARRYNYYVDNRPRPWGPWSGQQFDVEVLDLLDY